jgi:hypothetical protein
MPQPAAILSSRVTLAVTRLVNALPEDESPQDGERPFA